MIRAVILVVIMHVKTFKTDVFIVISNVIMYLLLSVMSYCV